MPMNIICIRITKTKNPMNISSVREADKLTNEDITVRNATDSAGIITEITM